eukprot:259831-Amphidinium_carterae.1
MYEDKLEAEGTSRPLRVVLSAWKHTLQPQSADASGFERALLGNVTDYEQSSVAIHDVLQGAITTVMLKGLPRNMQHMELFEELSRVGLDECYDFVYVPRHLPTGANLGYAFVNFYHAREAAVLVASWQGRLVFQSQHERTQLLPAAVQGIEALITMCLSKKLHRLRNANWRPFVRDPGLLPVAL